MCEWVGIESNGRVQVIMSTIIKKEVSEERMAHIWANVAEEMRPLCKRLHEWKCPKDVEGTSSPWFLSNLRRSEHEKCGTVRNAERKTYAESMKWR